MVKKKEFNDQEKENKKLKKMKIMKMKRRVEVIKL